MKIQYGLRVAWAIVPVSPSVTLPSVVVRVGKSYHRYCYISMILFRPDSNFCLIFFGKSCIITVESLETGAKVDPTTSRLRQLGNWLNSRISVVIANHG